MANICQGRPEHISFLAWVNQTVWSMPQIIAFFRWHTVQFNGRLDFDEYNEYYRVFKAKIYKLVA